MSTKVELGRMSESKPSGEAPALPILAPLTREQERERFPGGVPFSDPFFGQELTATVPGANRPFPEPIRVFGREISVESARLALDVIGMTAGAAAVPEVALPALILRAFGAAVGGATASFIGEIFDPSPDPLLRAGETAAIGLGGELLMPLAAPLGRKLLKPFARQLEFGAEAAIAEVAGKVSAETGAQAIITPGKATKSNLLDILENVADVALVGGGRVKAVTQAAEEVISNSINTFVTRFASTQGKEDVGFLIQDLVGQGTLAFRAQARSLYGRVDKLTGEALVSTSELKTAAEGIKSELAAGLKGGSSSTVGIVDDILARPDLIPFAESQILRSDLLAVGRSTTDLIPGKAKGIANRFAGILDRQMEEAARTISGDALDAWRIANRFWKSGAKTFNSQALKAIAKAEPEAVFNIAIRGQRPGSIRRLREVIDDPDVWRSVQGQALNDFLLKSSDEIGNLSGVKLLNQIKRFGTDAFVELFPKGADRARLFELAAALRVAQKKPENTAMRLATQFGQVGVILGAASGFFEPGEATMIFLGPFALSRILTSRALTKWLTIGLTANRASKEAATATRNLLAILGKEELIDRVISAPETPETTASRLAERRRKIEVSPPAILQAR